MAATRSASPVVYRPAPAPRVQIVRVQSPRTAPPKRRGARGRGKGASGIGMGAAMGGGLILGLIEKSDVSLPTIPILGRKGTAALVAWGISRATGSRLARDIAIGMAVVSAYELGKEGTISGL